MEDHSYEAGLTDEGLRLLGLAAVDARVLTIAYFGLRIAVYDLEQRRGTRIGYIMFGTIDERKEVLSTSRRNRED